MGTKRGDSQVDRGLKKGKHYPKAQHPAVKRTRRLPDEDEPTQSGKPRGKVLPPPATVKVKPDKAADKSDEPEVSVEDKEQPAPPPRRIYMVDAIEIDHDALFEAAKTHASYRQLGLIFGIGEMTMRNNFDHIIQEARAHRQKELLTAQFDTAITDRNPTMQIWLGKQYLEQVDVSRQERTGLNGGPEKQEVTQKVVAYIPENGRDS